VASTGVDTGNRAIHPRVGRLHERDPAMDDGVMITAGTIVAIACQLPRPDETSIE
jgi:hypothetical protein